MLLSILGSAAIFVAVVVLCGAVVILYALTPSLTTFRQVLALKVPNKAYKTHWWRPMLGDVPRMRVSWLP